MTQLPVQHPCPESRSCTWTQHNRKHFPFRGMTQADTINEPALYRSGMKPADIKALEWQTVQTGERTERAPAHSEYLREMDELVGWDEGREATRSFAECSGGITASRSFHGRPMNSKNRKVAGR